MSNPRRYRAPTANGAILADPPIEAWPQLVEENRRLLDRDDVKLGAGSLRDIRGLARRNDLIQHSMRADKPAPHLSSDVPLVLTGHQPELFHPGVWVKNFALNGLARRVGGTALNLIVDNDTMKSASLRFPILGAANEVRTEAIPFDSFSTEQAYEGRAIRDPELLRGFAERSEAAWKTWGYEPLLAKAWPMIASYPSEKIGERFSAARQRFEREWGCENQEFQTGWLCQTPAFASFVWHILTDLPRFIEVYNATLKSYRAANGLKSANHPAADLRQDGDWLEAPFWLPHRRSRRFPMYVHREGPKITYRMGDIGFDLPPLPGDHDEFIHRVPRYYEIRPRALTLTLFARLVLGDFFVHGIGGGKYDEVTDQIIRDYFGIEPPRYAVLSATLHLPLPHFPHTAADVRRMERDFRDLFWNPQRHAADGAELERLQREKVDLIANEPEDADERKPWYHRLRAVTERLRPFVSRQLGDAERALDQARVEARANDVLTRRDYSWVLYPEETLRPFLQKFLV